MGLCTFCGEKAGLFRKVHSKCKQKYDAGWAAMIEAATKVALSGERLGELQTRLVEIASQNLVPEGDVRKALIQGWEAGVNRGLDDSFLSQNEEDHLTSYAKQLGLSQDDLDQHGAWSRSAMAGALREILEGRVPTRAKVDGSLPFNFQKAESLVWVFHNVRYLESRVGRQYVGGYSGVSIRVMKGVYYRTGGFRGRPVETTETVDLGVGLFAITTKHLYFDGNQKSFRVPYAKIVSFEPYSDGIGIQRDAASAKPQTFITGNGWFVYNAVVNLAKM